MATYLLIHDPWIGPWSLDPLSLELEARGHQVLSISGPAGGEPGSVEGWAIAAVRVARESGGNVVMVGHSRGGLVVSAAAELDCNPFDSMVHITALVPATGWFEPNRRGVPGAPAGPGSGILLDGAMVFPSAGSAILETRVRPTQRRWRASNHAPIDRAVARSLGDSRDQDYILPCAYIECGKDLTFRSAFRHGLETVHPCDRIYYLDCDHASLLAHPIVLADALDVWAGQDAHPRR